MRKTVKIYCVFVLFEDNDDDDDEKKTSSTQNTEEIHYFLTKQFELDFGC